MSLFNKTFQFSGSFASSTHAQIAQEVEKNVKQAHDREVDENVSRRKVVVLEHFFAGLVARKLCWIFLNAS